MLPEIFMRDYEYFLDSNVFLRLIVKDDFKKVKECEVLFKKIKEGKIKAFTSNLVLSEIVWVGNSFYRIQKEDLIIAIKGILGFKNLRVIDDINPNLAIEIYEKFPVKFIDALIASNPKIFKKEVIVVSYDKDFDKIGVKRKEPKEIIKAQKSLKNLIRN